MHFFVTFLLALLRCVFASPIGAADERDDALTKILPCTSTAVGPAQNHYLSTNPSSASPRTGSWITSITSSPQSITSSLFPHATNILPTVLSPIFDSPASPPLAAVSEVFPTTSPVTFVPTPTPHHQSKRAVTGTGTCTTVYQITGTTTTWSPTTTLYPRITTSTEIVDCKGCVMWWGEHGIVSPGGQPTKTVSDWDGTATRFVAACQTS